MNFHGDPIIPKEEPMNLDSIEVPSFLLKPQQKPKQKKRIPRKQPSKEPIQVARVPAIVKQPILENKDDFIYQADIEEYSSMNLYLDELSEVRGIDKYKHLPERLVFVYKGGKERSWPLQRVLGENYLTLTKVFSAIKRYTGFSKIVKGEILDRIEHIRREWNSPSRLPRKMKIPYNGQKIHLQPFWMLEFRDEDGNRRFFKLEDQLSKASSQYLRWLQQKLNPKVVEEDAFYRQLQMQIESNSAKEGKSRVMPTREKK